MPVLDGRGREAGHCENLANGIKWQQSGSPGCWRALDIYR
jgi:hypothetical protein